MAGAIGQEADAAAGRAAARCAAARTEGNAAYSAGDLGSAAQRYLEALELWEEALGAVPEEKTLSIGTLVRYDEQGCFGTVKSAYPVFDEYFLMDLGSEQAIWVGEPGGDLRRFARKELKTTTQELLDLRFPILQNLAAVALKEERYEDAVHWAEAALSIKGQAPKALMRKGAALLRLGRAGLASDVLSAAKAAAPGDAEVSRLLREAEAKRSPNWVCVTGCCGPWGIICGGPVTTQDIMPQVVAPAVRRAKVEQIDDASLEGASGAAAPAAPSSPSEPPATFAAEEEKAEQYMQRNQLECEGRCGAAQKTEPSLPTPDQAREKNVSAQMQDKAAEEAPVGPPHEPSAAGGDASVGGPGTEAPLDAPAVPKVAAPGGQGKEAAASQGLAHLWAVAAVMLLAAVALGCIWGQQGFAA